MNDDLIYELTAKYLAGECSDEETEMIRSLIKINPEYELIFEELEKIWITKKSKPDAWDVEKVWDKLVEKINKPEPVGSIQNLVKRNYRPGNHHLRNNWFLRFAAVFLIIGLTVLSVIYLDNYRAADLTVLNELKTEKGQRAQIQLEDGSEIRLNVDSKISYPAQFDTNLRFIHLTGEAYFDIAADERPFLVYVDQAVIEIVGTRFNVQAYSDEDEIHVLVTDGKVNVGYMDSTDEHTLLEKGDIASLKRDGFMSVNQDVRNQDHLGWLDRRLTFNEVSLLQVSKTLERWYGISINLMSPEVEGLRLTATFEDESLQEILRVIQLALQLDIELKDKEVLISSTPDRQAG